MSQKDYEVYFKCKGRPTGMEDYYKDIMPTVASCLTESPRAVLHIILQIWADYWPTVFLVNKSCLNLLVLKCRHVCGYQRLNQLDEETGKFNHKELRKCMTNITSTRMQPRKRFCFRISNASRKVRSSFFY